jgi:hypothetical protein
MLLRSIRQALSDNIFQWQDLNEGGFDGPDSEVRSMYKHRLDTIKHTCNEMKADERTLHQLELRCESFAEVVSY